MARRKRMMKRGGKMRGAKGGAPMDSPYTPDMAGRGKGRSKKRR